MTGFLLGVAVVLVLDQLAPLLGLSPRGANEVVQFVDLLAHRGQLSVPTLVTGMLALGLVAGLGRTRLATVSSLVALVVPSVLVALLGWEGVTRVDDVAAQLRRPGKLEVEREVWVTPAEEVIGVSTAGAIA